MRPAVFLDRDDTLVVNRTVTANTAHPGSLYDPSLVRLVPGGEEACRLLKGAGFALVMVTNQGCVARGECGVAEVEATNARVAALVRERAGVELDGVYYCPYHPLGRVAPYAVEHWWRKPGPGMVVTAAKDLGLDLGRSWMIGDGSRDVEAGIAAGLAPSRCVLINGSSGVDAAGVAHAPDLLAAAGLVLAGSGAVGTRGGR